MANDTHNRSRRAFLKGAALASASGAAAAIAPTPAQSTIASAQVRAVGRPSARMIAAEISNPADVPQSKSMHAPGSDFMADVIKSLKFDYILANPAASFRSLHESLINYGNNKQPELLTCMHEESAVGMAHGYFKITGRPLPVLVHGTVGLQHAAMAVYNAWCDRVPIILIAGNDLDASKRPPGVPTYHAAQDINAIVRDYTKWDDQPVSLNHFAESMVRAYRIAMTPPHEPVVISLDVGLQEEPQPETEKVRIPRYVPSAPPQADSLSLREAAKLLVQASNPVIVADRAARTPLGMQLVTELAETLQVPVFDQRGRMNIASSHHLNQSGRGKALIAEADVILGLELSDFFGTVNAFIDNGGDHGHGIQEMRVKPSARLISISSSELLTKSNYQDFQRFQTVDIGMVGDAEASLPTLIEFVKAAIPASRKDEIAQRGERMKKAWTDIRARNIAASGFAWNASPISTARLSAEIWGVIKNEDWSLVSLDYFQSFWPTRLWAMDKYHSYIGGPGGYGVGYGAPAAVGAGLANKALGPYFGKHPV
jgi:acetolactate synthase-1/2/3 large subunit